DGKRYKRSVCRSNRRNDLRRIRCEYSRYGGVDRNDLRLHSTGNRQPAGHLLHETQWSIGRHHDAQIGGWKRLHRAPGYQLFPDTSADGGMLHILWWDTRLDTPSRAQTINLARL